MFVNCHVSNPPPSSRCCCCCCCHLVLRKKGKIGEEEKQSKTLKSLRLTNEPNIGASFFLAEEKRKEKEEEKAMSIGNSRSIVGRRRRRRRGTITRRSSVFNDAPLCSLSTRSPSLIQSFVVIKHSSSSSSFYILKLTSCAI